MANLLISTKASYEQSHTPKLNVYYCCNEWFQLQRGCPDWAEVLDVKTSQSGTWTQHDCNNHLAGIWDLDQLQNEVKWSLWAAFLTSLQFNALLIHSLTYADMSRTVWEMLRTDRKGLPTTPDLERVRPLGACPPTNRALTGKTAACLLFVLFHTHLSFRNKSPTLSVLTSNLPSIFCFSASSHSSSDFSPFYQLGSLDGSQPGR